MTSSDTMIFFHAALTRVDQGTRGEVNDDFYDVEGVQGGAAPFRTEAQRYVFFLGGGVGGGGYLMTWRYMQ